MFTSLRISALNPNAPVIWSRVPEPTLFFGATLSSVYMWKRSPCRPSQSWRCMIFHSPYWIIKNVQISLFLRVHLCRSVTVGFAELIFASLIRISTLNPKSRHYVTLATPRIVPVRRAKAFIWRRVVPLAGVTLPAEARQLAFPSCLAPPPPPRRVRDPNINGW